MSDPRTPGGDERTVEVSAVPRPDTELDIVRRELGERYEVARELGRGGMAMVFQAKDRGLERDVAVKVLPFEHLYDQGLVERFQREARTAAQLEHPNIIPIYSVDRVGRVVFFAMKFLRGGSLAKLLEQRKRLTPPEIRRVMHEAGSALAYAWSRGVVHRDIKPDNMMFDEFGRVVVADFGIARANSSQKLTGTGMAIGTPHYMSPEQVRAQPLDGRSDLYSLGIVAFQCLIGDVPYDANDAFTVALKHLQEPVPQLPPALAEDPDAVKLYAVIERMMAKEPEQRFADCEAMIRALGDDPVAPIGFRVEGMGVTGPMSPIPASRALGPSIRTGTPPANPPSPAPTAPSRAPAPAVSATPASTPAAGGRSGALLIGGGLAAAAVVAFLMLRGGGSAAVAPAADSVQAPAVPPAVASSATAPSDSLAAAAGAGAAP
ncbi:MAG: protein kinase, partial [Gemmatimonadales bacterium]|nr:protein kinase [Gemmatimonadales bacterium]